MARADPLLAAQAVTLTRPCSMQFDPILFCTMIFYFFINRSEIIRIHHFMYICREMAQKPCFKFPKN